jgi:surface protein
MFQNCLALTTVPLFNTANVTDMSSMFNACFALKNVSLLATGAGTTTTKFNTIFSSCPSLSRGKLGLAEYSISYTGCNLSKEAIEEALEALDTIGAAGQIITLTNNPGAPTPVSKTTTGTTAAGTSVIPVDVTGLEIGMQLTGTGTPLTTGRAVTFTAATNIVNLTAHGLQNNDEISFLTITSTTGIVINKRYYIVNSQTDTFQVSNTIEGAAIILTTDGSGTVRYSPVITSIGASDVTISRPTGAIGSGVALAFQKLKTSIAIFKGWSVTG